MTEVTSNELKLIYIQLVLMGIIGIFMLLYSAQPVSQNVNINSQIQNQSSASSDDAQWLSGLTAPDAGVGGILPNGASEILIVSSIVLIPLTIMNALTAIRIAKDFATQWL